jgi:hypothetical protein
MDSRGAPERIGRGHSCDQGLKLGADGRPAPGGPAGELGPVLAEAATLPTQDGVGGHDHEGLPPPGPDPRQPDPEETISRAKLGPRHRSPVHGELLAQGEVLEGELPVAAEEEREESKHVEQEGDHRTEILSGSDLTDQRLGPGRGFGEGHPLHISRASGSVVEAWVCVTQATGTAERETALAMATNLPPGATMGADKAYDTAGFIAGLRAVGVTPHVAQNTTRQRSAIDGRTTRHDGYGVSQRKRKRIEEIFGWAKTVALFRKTRHRGVRRVGWMFTFGLAVYNLVRIRNLTWQPAAA